MIEQLEILQGKNKGSLDLDIELKWTYAALQNMFTPLWERFHVLLKWMKGDITYKRISFEEKLQVLYSTFPSFRVVSWYTSMI